MTPAISAAISANIAYRLHQYSHDASASSYGLEAVEKLGLSCECVFKTLVVAWQQDNGQKHYAVALVPVAQQLNVKLMAKALAVKKVAMAKASDVERITGYVLGGVSPLGQKKSLPTVLNVSSRYVSSVFVSAGKRGLEIELSPDDLQQLTKASVAVLC